MTGDASGPHLHLQLDPPTSYPQKMAWFQSFAGVAFRWQDAPTPTPSTPTTGAVFAVVPQDKPSPSTNTVVGFTRGP